jgi:hypothetical protein
MASLHYAFLLLLVAAWIRLKKTCFVSFNYVVYIDADVFLVGNSG